MTSFGEWQALDAQSGMFMCMVCLEVFPLEDGYLDDAGVAWTLCQGCGEGGNQPGPKTGPSDSESQKSDPTQNI